MQTRSPIWSLLSPTEHEQQYNPRVSVPDFARYTAAHTPLNLHAQQAFTMYRDVPYGPHPLHTLDIFPAGSGTPVHVFLHGGYWRALDKSHFSFLAGVLVPLGITTVIVNYELCPASNLDAVVQSTLAAFAWTCHHIGDYDADPHRISMSGHSAGAHLLAEILAADWSTYGLDSAQPLCGATMISGIFDPTPTMLTSVNAELHLNADIAERHNMEHRTPRVHCPVNIVVGGQEPYQWIDQSFRYSHHLRQHRYDPEVHVIPGEHHFSILGQFLKPQSLVLQSVLTHSGKTLATQ